jgi:cell volume regulation protein A
MGFETVMLVGSGLLLLSVLASKASSRLGIPVLVLFLAIGMLAGSDGPGGIFFNDPRLSYDLGSVALAFILFSGGFDTDWRTIRSVLAPGLSLAIAGVAVSTLVVGLFAWKVLGLPPLVGMLLGAIVSSTDASAVFAVLRGSGIRLQRRLAPLLELESGSNDPMAVFLTITLTSVLTGGSISAQGLAGSFVLEMVLGSLIGVFAGLGAVWTINRVQLDYDGLYPVFTLALVQLVYFGAHAVHGNGFLAVYLAGVVLGSKPFLHKESLKQFHDGLAWLVQVIMFLTLGLLVFPSRLPHIFLPGLAMAAFLVFVARPLAVFVALLPFRKITGSEKLFVSWVGLRGAVPIVLATIPLTARVPQADRLFDLVFFVVVTSVVLQGTTISRVAATLGVVAPRRRDPVRSAPSNILEINLKADSPAAGRRVVDLHLPSTALLVLVTRDGRSFVPQGATTLREGDQVQLATRKADSEELQRLLAG